MKKTLFFYAILSSTTILSSHTDNGFDEIAYDQSTPLADRATVKNPVEAYVSMLTLHSDKINLEPTNVAARYNRMVLADRIGSVASEDIVFRMTAQADALWLLTNRDLVNAYGQNIETQTRTMNESLPSTVRRTPISATESSARIIAAAQKILSN